MLDKLVDIEQAESCSLEDRRHVLKKVRAQKGGCGALNLEAASVIAGARVGVIAPEVQAAACGDEGTLAISSASTGSVQSWAMVAAGCGYTRLLQAMLEQRRCVDPAMITAGDASPLTAAAMGGKVEALKLLMAHAGPSSKAVRSLVNMQDARSGTTALMVATSGGHVAAIELLLECDAEVNLRDRNGDTALKRAAENGHYAAAELLISRKANLDLPDVEGGTPLMFACQSGHIRLVSLLLESGARANLYSINGLTAIKVAITAGCERAVQLCSAYGGRRSGQSREHEAFAVEHNRKNVATWLARSRGWTPLHHLEILTVSSTLSLLRCEGASSDAACADIYAASADNETPLSIAKALHERGEAPLGSPAAMVLMASRWCSQSAHLFPATTQARAGELFRIGFRLSRKPAFVSVAQGFLDIWLEIVMPLVLSPVQKTASAYSLTFVQNAAPCRPTS